MSVNIFSPLNYLFIYLYYSYMCIYRIIFIYVNMCHIYTHLWLPTHVFLYPLTCLYFYTHAPRYFHIFIFYTSCIFTIKVLLAHTHTPARVNVCVIKYINTRIFICVYINIYIYIYIHIHVNMYLYIYIFIYVYKFMYIFVCVRIFMLVRV